MQTLDPLLRVARSTLAGRLGADVAVSAALANDDPGSSVGLGPQAQPPRKLETRCERRGCEGRDYEGRDCEGLGCMPAGRGGAGGAPRRQEAACSGGDSKPRCGWGRAAEQAVRENRRLRLGGDGKQSWVAL